MVKQEYKKVLEQISQTDQALEQRMEEAKEINKGIDHKEYNSYKTKIDSMSEELDRPLDEKRNKVKNKFNDLQERKKDGELGNNLRDGMLVDSEDFEQAWEIIELYRNILPRFVIKSAAYEAMSDQQDLLIDISKLAHDESRVKEMMDQLLEMHEDQMKKITENFEDQMKYMKRRVEQKETSVNDISEATKSLSEAMEQLNQTVQMLEEQRKQEMIKAGSQPVNGSTQNSNMTQQNSGAQQNMMLSSDTSESNSEGNSIEDNDDDDSLKSLEKLDVEDHRKLAKKYRIHGDNWSLEDYANEIGTEPERVENQLEMMRERGYIQ